MMTQQPHQEADRIVREKMQSYRPQVPGHVWDQIESVLPANPQGAIAKNPRDVKRRVRSSWGWVAAALLVMTSIGWLIRSHQNTEIFLRGMPAASPDPLSEAFPKEENIAPRMSETPSGKIAASAPTQSREHSAAANPNGGGDPPEERLLNVATAEMQVATPPLREAPSVDVLETESGRMDLLVTSANGNTPLEMVRSGRADSEAVTAIRARHIDLSMDEHLVVSPNYPTMDDSTAVVMSSRPPVPRLLNLMASRLSKDSEKRISFSMDEEGSLKITLNKELMK